MVLFADIYEDVTNIFFQKHCKWFVITWEKKRYSALEIFWF